MFPTEASSALRLLRAYLSSSQACVGFLVTPARRRFMPLYLPSRDSVSLVIFFLLCFGSFLLSFLFMSPRMSEGADACMPYTRSFLRLAGNSRRSNQQECSSARVYRFRRVCRGV